MLQMCFFVFYICNIVAFINSILLMKKITFVFISTLLLAGLNACQNKEESAAMPEGLPQEGKYVRIVVADADQATITMLTPRDNIQTRHSISNAKSAVYASASGRYAFLIQREQNLVQVFDSGIEDHDDHAHQSNSKVLTKTWSFLKPTHFSSHGAWSVIFNDGDGGVALFNESELESKENSYEPKMLPLEKTAYHGAMSVLENNLFAVTEKVVGTAGALPQKVKVIDQNGTMVQSNNALQVTGIHGNASNGKTVVFGSTDGVLVASASKISLIPNSGKLNNQSGNWLGSIFGDTKLNHFYGTASKLGLFRIDLTAQKITPVWETEDILSVKLIKNNLLVLTKSGSLRLYDAQTGSLRGEKTALYTPTAQAAEGSINPTVACSEKYLYVCVPNEGKIKVLDMNMQLAHTFSVSGKPSNISFLGSLAK